MPDPGGDCRLGVRHRLGAAIFAITPDPFIVYTSNIFAILGLRALYFALSAVVHRFHYLKYARRWCSFPSAPRYSWSQKERASAGTEVPGNACVQWRTPLEQNPDQPREHLSAPALISGVRPRRPVDERDRILRRAGRTRSPASVHWRSRDCERAPTSTRAWACSPRRCRRAPRVVADEDHRVAEESVLRL